MRNSPEGTIEQIWQNLQDRYLNGIPIVKELIQNADDADATQLHIGWIRRLPGAEHLLLQGPLLFLINNGIFTDKHANAINSMGLSSKAGDRYSIGKFGLGLKSIFHICEAFFYSANTDKERYGIVNPWADGKTGRDHFHQGWDEDSFSLNDRQQITNYLTSITEHEKYLCLIIPLRQESQLQGCTPIKDHWPGDSDKPPAFFFEGIELRMVHILPMLQSLTTIQGWLQNEDDIFQLDNVFSVTLDDTYQRRRYRPNHQMKTDRYLPLKGQVKVQSILNNISNNHLFSGMEMYLQDDDIIKSLLTSDKWRKRSVLNRETKKREDFEDKADPHCAVYFTELDKHVNGDELTISKAVFLPIDNFLPDEKSNLVLTLHGYYFLDPGRTKILNWDFADFTGTPSNEQSLQKEWNGRLAQRGTLSLILPALAQFVKQAELPNEKILSLTQALKGSDLFKYFRKYICAENQWVCCLKAGTENWQLLPADEPIFEIPRSRSKEEPNRPFKALPALTTLNKSFTYPNIPRLSPPKQSTAWSADLLLQVLEIPDVSNLFQKSVMMEYLVDFIEAVPLDERTQAVAKKFIDLSLQGFRSHLLSQLSQDDKVKAQLRKFLSFIPDEQKLMLDIDNQNLDTADLVFRALSELSLSVLIIPSTFSKDGNQRQETSILLDDAQKILHCLAALQPESSGEDLKSELGLQIFKAVGANHKSELLRRCNDLPLFKGRKLINNELVLLSLNTLISMNTKKTVFTYASDGGMGLAPLLQANLADVEIVLITKAVADEALKPYNIEILPCNAKACFDTLATKPKLNDPSKRGDLIIALLSGTSTGDQLARKCVRYLLHNTPSQIDDVDTALLIDRQKNDVWTKIIRESLRLIAAEWRLVPETLTSILNDIHRQFLVVQEINQNVAENLLREVGADRISLQFAPEECDLLLERIKDDDLARQLKIHALAGTTKNFVAIDDNTYLESNFNLDHNLLQHITVIQRNSKAMLAARQRELVQERELSPAQAIKIALKQTTPAQYYQIILNAFEKTDDPDAVLLNQLKEHKWLPTSGKGNISPTQILFISGLEDDIARLISSTQYGIVNEKQLKSDVLKHPVFTTGKLQKYVYPKTNRALEMLGQLMAEDDHLHLGLIDVDLLTPELLSVFVNLFDVEVLPACAILRNVLANVKSPGQGLNKLLKPLRHPLSPEHLINILNSLTKRHKEARRNSERDQIFRIHLMYLQAAKMQDSFSESILPKITLLNRNNEWQSTAKLCFKIEGIADSAILNGDQESLLNKSIVSSNLSATADSNHNATDKNTDSIQKLDEEFAQAAHKLDVYFKDWKRYIDPEIIGGFLCVLGDQPEIKDKAEHYLQKRSVKATRSLFETDETDFNDVMAGWRYTIEIIPTNVKTQTVNSLVGQSFEAPLQATEDLGTVFVEDQQKLSITRLGYYKQKYQYYRLRLRQIDPGDLSPKKLSELLRNSTQKLFYVFYDQPNIDLTEAWDNLDKSEQLDIGVAQNLLLNSAFFYLRPFGIHTHQDVKPIFDQWEDARQQEAELQHNHAEADDQSLHRLLFPSKQKREDAEKKLKSLLVTNEEVQYLILEDLRKKVTQFTYKPQSIPFEIFQNADDAVIQLEKMIGATELSDIHTRFVVGIDEESLYFMHWGRPINDFQRGSFDKGREAGYHQDLEKMLVLSYSDKSVEIDTGSVTGKFGLGFKSVFLATDSPQVVSGRLDFRVLGGIYPERLTSTEVDRLNALLGEAGQHKGTIIFLPILPTIKIQQNILQNFSELAHILLIFSRRIKQLELDNQNYNVAWKEKSLLNLDNVFVGDIQPGNRKGIVFRSEPVISEETICGSAVLLQVGPDGVCPFPDNIPPVWVTAPTKRVAGFGFAINSLFDIDPGRAQLDTSSPKNMKIAKAMGDDLGESFCQLFDAAYSENWEDFQKTLGMKNVGEYDFWHSVWELLGYAFNKKSNGSELRELLHLVLWGTVEDPGGMTRLFTDRPALPTGLNFDNYQCLTKIEINKTLLVAQGELEKAEIFAKVSTWPSFIKKVSPGKIISSRVNSTLEALLPQQLKSEAYKLHRAIREEIPANGHISPELASQLGILITRKFLSEIDSNEKSEIHKQFEVSQVKFLGQDKNYHPARELLVFTPLSDDMTDDEKRSATDEQLRTRFAPHSSLLSLDYRGRALDFFRACRQRLEADAKTMAHWALTTTNREKQCGVLAYLLKGRLRLELAENIKPAMNGTWLGSLSDQQLRHKFDIADVNDRSMILALLGLVREQETEERPKPKPVNKQAVKSTLHQIYNWWQREQAILTREYEHDTFPGWYTPADLNGRVISDDIRSRQAWLTLFMLGSSHTMGYFRPQTHRSFLDLCYQNGWWNVFSNPKATAEDWIKVLDDYLGQKVEEEISYQHWMRQFVYIYQIATGLSEYSGAFLEINKESRRFNLTSFTRLKSSARFGGGSYAASRIDRTLGAGACFVIRELVRSNKISSKTAYEHCYTPIKRVRNCFFELGCEKLEDTTNVNNSRIMYQFLSRHLGDEQKITFNQSFDLPFLMISKKWGTIKGFLDTHTAKKKG